MPHLTKESVTFLRDLAKNNDREWFNKNKKRFEQHVKAPWEGFVAETIEKLSKVEPALAVPPADAIFRIYKDTRFSKDKSPYKDHVSALVTPSGRKGMGEPGVYFHLSGKEFGVATGAYAIEKDALERLRRHIMKNDKEFRRLLADKKLVAAFGELQGEKNKVLPKEFKEAADEQPLLYNKQFYFWRSMKPEEALKDSAPKMIADSYKAALAINRFLFKAM